ncbi:MAG: hypothetical protein IJ134_04115 [Bacilli bacterium]|nr:hypothetical protein [Bacilli bacterium]
MDKNSIIDKITFDVCTHAEDHPDVFVCDKVIAPAIAHLNKKGYKTFASCSGHYRIEFYEYLKEDINKLKEYQKNERIIIKNIRDKDFDYWKEIDKTVMYILFDKIYEFETIPDDFELKNFYGKSSIECSISFYTKNNEHRTMLDVMKEIENKGIELEQWAKSLPKNK